MNTSTSLPSAPPLPVPELAAGLRNVTNSYRFFWLLAILDHVRAGGAVAPESLTEGAVFPLVIPFAHAF